MASTWPVYQLLPTASHSCHRCQDARSNVAPSGQAGQM